MKSAILSLLIVTSSSFPTYQYLPYQLYFGWSRGLYFFLLLCYPNAVASVDFPPHYASPLCFLKVQ